VIGTAIDAGWADFGEGGAGVEDEACHDAITTGLVEVGKSLEMFFAFEVILSNVTTPSSISYVVNMASNH